VEFKDYYKVMGVARDATEAQIKQAYRKLARKYHPDVSKEKDAEARFKELGEAYEVLKTPDKRSAYDHLGTGPRPGEQFNAPPGWDSGFEFNGTGSGDDAEYSDFFASLFGRDARGGGRRGRRRAASTHGEDQHAKILLDLEASLLGGQRSLTLRAPSLDPDGHVTTKDRTLNVQIPKGILAGQSIRLAGQGAPAEAAGGTPGDLFLEVEFHPHRLYRVDGRDLYLSLPVAPWEAALGAAVATPTPSGEVQLKVPAGSRAGAKLRLKGRGIPATPPGDLYAVLEIALPPAQEESARAAYLAFAAALPFNPRAALGA
jgi:curved DNA-binding protein